MSQLCKNIIFYSRATCLKAMFTQMLWFLFVLQGELMSSSSGMSFTPHVIVVSVGEVSDQNSFLLRLLEIRL